MVATCIVATGCGGPLYKLSVKDGKQIKEVENGGVPFLTVEHYQVMGHVFRQDVHEFKITTKLGLIKDGSPPKDFLRSQESLYYTTNATCAGALLKAFSESDSADTATAGTTARGKFEQTWATQCEKVGTRTPPKAWGYSAMKDCVGRKNGTCTQQVGMAVEWRTRAGDTERYLNVDRRAGTTSANFTLNEKGES